MRKIKEIKEYMDEAFDIVWFVRTLELLEAGKFDDSPLDIIEGAKKAATKICNKYGIENEEKAAELCDDWNYGYWSGILAALRWVTGEEKDCLNT